MHTSTEAIHSNWKVLDSVQQLEQLIADSHNKPVVIFKHSISCGRSAAVKSHLHDDWVFSETDMDFYYLDLINHRTVSNAVADQLGIVHQSPQVIVIKGGKVIYDASHFSVGIEALQEAVSS